MPTFSASNLPEGEWGEYRKRVTTRMIRIDGPFNVEMTLEVIARNRDGLCVTRRG